ncbi:MAG TPA: hypothetical protein PKK12_10965 [Candidatus Aminicenantes bacterium]|nr:hypothetical protein [Candidatus Aminicenantes bacterium]
MKRACSLVAAVGFVFTILACSSGGKYGEAKTVLEKQVAGMETFVTALEKAGSSAEVAAAFTGYAETMKVLAPQMKALAEKYPDLKNEKEPPAELKPLMDQIQAISQRMAPATMKAAQYMMDPAVQEAQRKFMEAAASFK